MAFVAATPLLLQSTRSSTSLPALRAPLRRTITPRRRRCLRIAPSCAVPPTSAEGRLDPDLDPTAAAEPAESFPDPTHAADPADQPPPDPFQTAAAQLQASADLLFDTAFTPVAASCTVLQRRWQSAGGNYILHPLTPPKAVLHFLGGAFFAAAPHISYNALLSHLGARGYVIVATPYDTSFDHLRITADVVSCWERVESDLAVRYGDLPVVGLSHSAGGILHALAGSLFDDACPKAGNVLVSFCNRAAADAIPAYDTLVGPVAMAAVAARDALPDAARAALNDLPATLERAVRATAFTPKRFVENVVPSLREASRLVEQVWPLLEVVAGREENEDGEDVDKEKNEGDDDGAIGEKVGSREEMGGGPREFYPGPDEVEAAVRRMYRVSETLVVRFEGDALDDGERLAEAVRRRGEVGVVTLQGGHLTPLAQELPDFVGGRDTTVAGLNAVFGLSGGGGAVGMAAVALQEGLNVISGRELARLEVVIDEWVEAAIANGRF